MDWDANPSIPIWDAGLPIDVLTDRPNTYPIIKILTSGLKKQENALVYTLSIYYGNIKLLFSSMLLHNDHLGN